MRDEIFYEGEFYHVYHRGVDKRVIFVDDLDRRRMYWMMYLLNDWTFDSTRSNWIDRYSKMSVQTDIPEIDKRKRMVDIASFNLLGNHFHMLLRAKSDDSISRFMHRLQVSHSKYFNVRHERSGALMDSRFGAVHIKSDAQLLHVPLYIHLNSLDVYGLPWRDGGISNWDEAQKLMDSHKYSSHHVYEGDRQELPVVDEDLLRELCASRSIYLDALKGWSGRYIIQDNVVNELENTLIS